MQYSLPDVIAQQLSARDVRIEKRGSKVMLNKHTDRFDDVTGIKWLEKHFNLPDSNT